LNELLRIPPNERKEMIKYKLSTDEINNNIVIIRTLNTPNSINTINMIKNGLKSNNKNENSVIIDKGKGRYLDLNELLFHIQKSKSVMLILDLINNFKDNINELFNMPLLLIELHHAIKLNKQIMILIKSFWNY
jgi:hypothetical protein